MSTSTAFDAAHHRITSTMRERLRAGVWATGQVLPGRRDLAREFGVSVATVERAMVPLLNEGVLRTDGRRGTFVHDGGMGSRIEPARGNGAAMPQRAAEQPFLLGIAAAFPRRNGGRGGQHDYWTRLMTDALERAFGSAGNNTVCVNRTPPGREKPVPLEDTIRRGFEMGVDGMVVQCHDLPPEVLGQVLTATQDCGPVVSIASAELDRPFPHVVNDDYSAGYQAAQHLLRQGVEKITVVAPYRATWSEKRVAGVRAALLHRGLPEGNLRVLRGEDKPWVYYQDQLPPIQAAIHRAYAEGWRLEGAIVAVNDGVAFAIALEGLADNRLPGRDYVLLGFDDHVTARLLGLTSMRPPLEAMAHEAAQLLMQAVNGTRTGLKVSLQAELVARRSTAVANNPSAFPESYDDSLEMETIRHLLMDEFDPLPGKH